MKFLNLAAITCSSSCLQKISQNSSLSASMQISEQLMVAVKDLWHYRQLEIAHRQCNFVCHLLSLAWQLKIALQCPKHGSVHCLAKQHIQYSLAPVSARGHDWIWRRRGMAIATTERCAHNLAIFSLPKRHAFHSLCRNITLTDMPLLQVVSSSSVSGQIAVALSHEIFQVKHESYNVTACLTLPCNACA